LTHRDRVLTFNYLVERQIRIKRHAPYALEGLEPRSPRVRATGKGEDRGVKTGGTKKSREPYGNARKKGVVYPGRGKERAPKDWRTTLLKSSAKRSSPLSPEHLRRNARTEGEDWRQKADRLGPIKEKPDRAARVARTLDRRGDGAVSALKQVTTALADRVTGTGETSQARHRGTFTISRAVTKVNF